MNAAHRFSWAVFALLLSLTGLARCWNYADVFVDGHVFFIDGDCYSRMTRVQRVMDHPFAAVHQHEFENWPEGVQPHTTAPFDDLTAALAFALRPFTKEPLDLAGALVSLLIGAAIAAFLWAWAGRLKLVYRVPMIFLFATSPILVHGTALGRPDHQSLLMLCMAVALGAEAALLRGGPSARWAAASGFAWGLGLWTSLYEPAILLIAVALWKLLDWIASLRSSSTPRAKQGSVLRLRYAAIVLVLLVATFVDGWRSPVPDAVVLKYFPLWSRTIGELQSMPPWSPALFRWVSGLLLLSPALLGWLALRRDASGGGGTSDRRCASFWLVLLLATWALACWQARWGYFFALVFVMSLPWQLLALARLAERLWRPKCEAVTRRFVLALFAASLWPVGAEWADRLGCSPAGKEGLALRYEQREDNLALYDVAQQLAGPRRLPVLAPWWLSPALAYWSRQPCVAGSSHESLAGIVDTALFYTSEDPVAALAILARRRAACVVAYEPSRVLQTSAAILGKPIRGEGEGMMAFTLYNHPRRPPEGLQLVYSNGAFRVFLWPDGLEASAEESGAK